MKRGVGEGGTPNFGNTMIGFDIDMAGKAAAAEAVVVVVGCTAAAAAAAVV